MENDIFVTHSLIESLIEAEHLQTRDLPLPKVSGYGEYSSNYGKNALRVDILGMTLYYSYKTLVAFKESQFGLVCRKNEWGVTTGKHLNLICPDHSQRKEAEEFGELFRQALRKRSLSLSDAELNGYRKEPLCDTDLSLQPKIGRADPADPIILEEPLLTSQ